MNLLSIITYIVKRKGGIRGKKAFQKYLYFLDAKGVPTGLLLRIHHYGPYSSELDYQSDYFELLGAIDIQKDGVAFNINPGNKADEIMNDNKEYIKSYQSIIDEVISTLPTDAKTLELWSTTHFVANSLKRFYGGYTKDKVIVDVKGIKQDKFSEYEIGNALDNLLSLRYLN